MNILDEIYGENKPKVLAPFIKIMRDLRDNYSDFVQVSGIRQGKELDSDENMYGYADWPSDYFSHGSKTNIDRYFKNMDDESKPTNTKPIKLYTIKVTLNKIKILSTAVLGQDGSIRFSSTAKIMGSQKKYEDKTYFDTVGTWIGGINRVIRAENEALKKKQENIKKEVADKIKKEASHEIQSKGLNKGQAINLYNTKLKNVDKLAEKTLTEFNSKYKIHKELPKK